MVGIIINHNQNILGVFVLCKNTHFVLNTEIMKLTFLLVAGNLWKKGLLLWLTNDGHRKVTFMVRIMI